VDEKTTQRILKQARRQQQHLEDELSELEAGSSTNAGKAKMKSIKPSTLGKLGADLNESSDDDGEFDVLSHSAGDYEEVVNQRYILLF